MADRITLQGELRTEVGTKSAAKLRKEGKVPAVMYGHGKESVSFALSCHALTEGLHHGHRLVDVAVGGKSETLLLKDIQYDYLGKVIIHADFVRVNLAELVTVSVVLEMKGTAQGTHEGGIVDNHVSAIDIECKVSEIPESIVVSLKEIGIGDSIHAGDVELPAGAKLISDPELLIVTCHLAAAEKSTEDLEAEMPSAPEVITEKAEEPEEK